MFGWVGFGLCLGHICYLDSSFCFFSLVERCEVLGVYLMSLKQNG